MKRTVLCSWILCVGALLLGSCGESDKAPPAKTGTPPPEIVSEPVPGPAWIAEVVFESDAPLGGCAVGELDPERDGLELVATDSKGRIHLVTRDGDGWKHEVLVTMPGELIQCAIGDCSRAFDGNEIVAVGMAEGTEDDGGKGIAVAVVKGEDGWRREAVLEKTFPALVHGVAVSDMDEGGGAEAVVVGFDMKATVLSHRGDQWSVTHEVGIDGPGKAAVGYRTGVAIAVQGGHISTVLHHSVSHAEGTIGLGGWTKGAIGAGGVSMARIDTDGSRLLAAADDGRLYLFTLSAVGVEVIRRTTVHEEGMKLRGAALGDFDPTHPGLEAASAGYEGKVVVLVESGEAWEPTVVYEDEKSLHHLAHGDVLPDVPGEELLTCGHSGKLVLIRRR